MPSLSIDDAMQQAIDHHRNGRLAEAEQLYRHVLTAKPDAADALHLLGVLIGLPRKDQAPDLKGAVDLVSRAIALQPTNATFFSNLSNLLCSLRRHPEAIAAAKQSLVLNPQGVQARINLANALLATGDDAGAAAVCREAIALEPRLPHGYVNLGIALRRSGEVAGAIAAYRRALELQPGLDQTHSDLGIALASQRHFDEAIDSFNQALRLQPGLAPAWNNLGSVLKDVGRLEEAADAYQRALALHPGFVEAETGLISTLLYRPGATAADLREALARWNRQHALPLEASHSPHANDPSPDRRLRIGYVSGDFREHVVARNILPFLRRHDHQQFEIFLYSNVVQEDAATQEFRCLADHWRPIAGLTDEAAASLIRQDGIDILVDLSLHTLFNRLLVFARKPAPVQATFAGYPGSTGLTAIDYRLTDPYLDPPGDHANAHDLTPIDPADALYSEKSIRLPHTFWCYEARGDEPEVNPLPALRMGFVTFGCLNNFFKLNDFMVALWAQTLVAVPGSRLLLQAPQGSARSRLLGAFESRGISPERVVLYPRLPHAEYLALHNQVDIALDTVPYNAHTTALDGFYMGVPLVTLVGQTVVGRAGLSQLTNLNLPELIAQKPADYVHIARDLAADLPRLAGLRQALRSRLRASPLMDAAGFTRGIEKAWRTMWQRWCGRVAR